MKGLFSVPDGVKSSFICALLHENGKICVKLRKELKKCVIGHPAEGTSSRRRGLTLVTLRNDMVEFELISKKC